MLYSRLPLAEIQPAVREALEGAGFGSLGEEASSQASMRQLRDDDGSVYQAGRISLFRPECAEMVLSNDHTEGAREVEAPWPIWVDGLQRLR